MLEDEEERLVEADALLSKGDLRGELIVIQCELARGGFDRARGRSLRRRELQLLGQAGTWTAPLKGLVTHPIFRRGYVDEVTIDAKTFIEHEARLFRLAPRVRWIRLTGLTRDSNVRDLECSTAELHRLKPTLEAVFASGRIRWFEPVDANVTYAYTGEMSIYERSHSFADDIVEWLDQTGALPRMRGLRFLGTRATDLTLDLLGRRDARLEELLLEGYDLVPEYRPNELEKSKLRPRCLGLDASQNVPMLLRLPLVEDVVDLRLGDVEAATVTVPPRVRCLRARLRFPKYDLAELVAAPALAAIEELVVREAPHGHGAAEIDLAKVAERARLDALRVLRLDGMKASNIEAFLASPFGRELEMLDVGGRLYFPG